ncbi:hypothetical protein BDN72DRAFT_113905 [Pluteus cervinus]|uniref:Uncharacterized protein n=1 Tax=Pluteus cervinus TaxID=181527 RepID=A0ACD3AN39_9AGAR|nr:hypothetical protein BDN72DRAFT_113905 [Pluteus cervinus]
MDKIRVDVRSHSNSYEKRPSCRLVCLLGVWRCQDRRELPMLMLLLALGMNSIMWVFLLEDHLKVNFDFGSTSSFEGAAGTWGHGDSAKVESVIPCYLQYVSIAGSGLLLRRSMGKFVSLDCEVSCANAGWGRARAAMIMKVLQLPLWA